MDYITYPYAVIYNGVYYSADTQIPKGKKKAEKKTPAKRRNKTAVNGNDEGTGTGA